MYKINVVQLLIRCKFGAVVLYCYYWCSVCELKSSLVFFSNFTVILSNVVRL